MWRISTHALTEGDGCIDRRRKVHEISTHALTEGDHLDVPWRPSDIISTHALTEGDELCDPMTAALGNFNSRPHGGRRNLSAHLFFFFIFQLTPSRRATVYVTHWPPCILYFNSRPHGGRLIWICLLNYSFVFQLTPSRRATVSPGIAVCKFLFQLTPSRRATSLYFWIASSSGLFQLTPSRRATEQINCNFFLHLISTHALTEGDYSPDMLVVSAGLFQLTPSRRATGWFVLASLLVNISTHALTEGDMDLSYHWRIFFISTHALTEGDAQNIYDSISAGHFNSRPHGGRQRTRADDNTGGVFQLTPSRRATSLYFWIASSSGLFQLTPSRRATGTSRN